VSLPTHPVHMQSYDATPVYQITEHPLDCITSPSLPALSQTV
jgi:hypothetical protein